MKRGALGMDRSVKCDKISALRGVASYEEKIVNVSSDNMALEI